MVNEKSQGLKNIAHIKGDNFISLPLEPDHPYITEVLRSIDGKYSSVRYYDASDSVWKSYYPNKPDYMSDLWYLYPYMGFWVSVPEDMTLTVYGTHFSEYQEVELFIITNGWNMVGYPSDIPRSRTMGLNNLKFGTHIDLIQWFDGETKTWHNLEDFENFELSRGYWFHMISLPTPPIWKVPVG